MVLGALVSRGEPVPPELTVVWHSEIVDHTETIRHPKPDLSVDDSLLADLGCPVVDGESNRRRCSFDEMPSALAALRCESAGSPDPLLGGLEPSYPMAVCTVARHYLYRTACMVDVGVGYVIERRGKYERIVSESKLRAVYAPIESEEEALSYALAATGLAAHYDTGGQRELGVHNLISPGYEYFVEHLENTHVTETQDGYLVYLFDYRLCGCGQHETVANTVHVTRSGRVRRTHAELVYRDLGKICVD